MVRHGTLSHRPGIAADADATLTIARDDLDAAAVRDFVALLDDFEFWFDIVTP